MTPQADILTIVDALGLPPEARINARVPKKLLVEQGAPTSGDKRAIQDGIDELQWLAACKPTTIGVPAFVDEAREYLEIAVVACAFRPNAKAGRLIELIHRAIPYPLFLITSDEAGIAVSVAHKRRAQNEAGRTVTERIVSTGALTIDNLPSGDRAFLSGLSLARQPHKDLFALYEGWLAQIEAQNAARLAGSFVAVGDNTAIERRRVALAEYEALSREITALRSQAGRTTQISNRVDLNQKIKSMESAIVRTKNIMLGGS